MNALKSGFPTLLSALLCQNRARVYALLVRVKTLDLSESEMCSLAFYLISFMSHMNLRRAGLTQLFEFSWYWVDASFQ